MTVQEGTGGKACNLPMVPVEALMGARLGKLTLGSGGVQEGANRAEGGWRQVRPRTDESPEGRITGIAYPPSQIRSAGMAPLGLVLANWQVQVQVDPLSWLAFPWGKRTNVPLFQGGFQPAEFQYRNQWGHAPSALDKIGLPLK